MVRRIVGVLAVLAMLAAGCSSSEQASGGSDGGPPETPVKIRLGLVGPAEEILYVMQTMPEVTPNQGTWYTVEWSDFPGTPFTVQGMAAGTLDGGTVGSFTIASAIDQGADLVVMGEHIEERDGWAVTTWLARKDSDIATVADLKGKTVGTPAVGAYTDYVADAYIRDQGQLEANKDYKKVEVGFPQQQEALAAGRIDAGVFPQPFFGRAMATGEFKVLFKATDVQPTLIPIIHAFRRDFVEEHPEVMKKFMEDWVAAAQYVHDPANRESVIKASSEVTKIPVEVLERFLLTKQDYYRPPNGAVNLEGLQQDWDFFRTQGGINQRLTVADHVLEEYLPPQA